jgi:tetratricopeptide (TPR) repeat protein
VKAFIMVAARLARVLVAAALAAAMPTALALDVEEYSRLIAAGKAQEAVALLDQELQRKPNNPHLWYDRGVAAYAAGKFDEAVLAFDKAEESKRTSLAAKALRQKGNAEFHLGLDSRASNLDETIHHWQTALEHYRAALKRSPADAVAKPNHAIVLKLLMELLLNNARKHLDSAHRPGQNTDSKINELRTALEEFQEATQADPASEPARQGELSTRSELAQTLAEEGAKAAQPQADQPASAQTPRMQKGVNQLEDAHALLPQDQPITEQLAQAKQNLANALTEQAKQAAQQARQSSIEAERVAAFNRAIRHAEAALEQVPQHAEAQRTLADAQADLAAIHEKKGDSLARQADQEKSLETATHRLDDALMQYRDAEELQPKDLDLKSKARRTQEKLQDNLQKLADKLLPDPPPTPGKRPESPEQQAARYEAAQDALQDLAQLKPDPKTEQQLAEVEKKLARIRERLAEPQPTSETEPGDQGQPPPKLPEMARPLQKAPPPAAREYKSDQLARKTKDY